MALSITGIQVELSGRVATDITALEIDGAAVAIGVHGEWTWSASLPAGTRQVSVTAIAPTRRETRMVEIGSGVAPAGVA